MERRARSLRDAPAAERVALDLGEDERGATSDSPPVDIQLAAARARGRRRRERARAAWIRASRA
jgi:hypothetical protein